MLINVGAVLGYLTLIWLTDAIGRRWSYFLIALGCAAANLLMFSQIRTLDGLLWFSPIFGFFAVGGFGSLAIYLPELFRPAFAPAARVSAGMPRAFSPPPARSPPVRSWAHSARRPSLASR
jgi:hypothetical protein